jgi:hypothetical protein
MTAQELLESNGIQLKNYAPGKYSTICPECSHDRKKRKLECLSIKIDGQGATWYCHHCGWTGPGKGSGKGKANGQGGNFAATYDYPGFQKVRYPKGHDPRFRIRHRDGSGWKWGAGGADTSVLYRKDEVDEAIAASHIILVVEGEKDVDRLWSIGIPATCNAHGAADPTKNKYPKWKVEHSAQLRGADIVVIPDHDSAGYWHADTTCQLSFGVAKSVRRLVLRDHWPNCPKGGDVSDYLDAGHTREDLDALIEQAKTYAPGTTGQSGPQPGATSKITATPHVWRDPSTIPPRDFLYDHHIIRRYVTGDVSMGGVGKTSEAQVEIVAMVTGRDLLGVKPKRQYRVWYINLEDPQDEIDRRFAAIFKHYKITQTDLGNRLFTDSGRKKNFIVAREGKTGIEFDQQVITEIEDTIRENAIDCVIVDPYVNSARFAENDNNAMAAIIETVWAAIAERQNCAILLLHHVRKGGAGHNGYTVEDARGAGALINSCRSLRVFNTMTKEESEKAGIDQPRSYFRIDSGKVNLAPPPEESEWRKFVSVPLGNAMGDCPEDRIGVVTLWDWPNPMENLTVADLHAAQKAVNTGGPWRKDSQAKDWVGKPIANALHLDLSDKMIVAKIKGALKVWLKNKMFKEVDGWDQKKGRACTMIEVGIWANSSQTVKTKPGKTQTAGTTSNSKFRPVVVGPAPAGVDCVQCQTANGQPVYRIRDGRVPSGQPGSRPECLHDACAEAWFTGKA